MINYLSICLFISNKKMMTDMLTLTRQLLSVRVFVGCLEKGFTLSMEIYFVGKNRTYNVEVEGYSKFQTGGFNYSGDR